MSKADPSQALKNYLTFFCDSLTLDEDEELSREAAWDSYSRAKHAGGIPWDPTVNEQDEVFVEEQVEVSDKEKKRLLEKAAEAYHRQADQANKKLRTEFTHDRLLELEGQVLPTLRGAGIPIEDFLRHNKLSRGLWENLFPIMPAKNHEEFIERLKSNRDELRKELKEHLGEMIRLGMVYFDGKQSDAATLANNNTARPLDPEMLKAVKQVAESIQKLGPTGPGLSLAGLHNLGGLRGPLDKNGAFVKVIPHASPDLLESSQKTPANEPAVSHRPPRTTHQQLLLSWSEILVAIDRPNNASEHRKIRRLNDDYGGPIQFLGRGKQPKANKEKLLEWWGTMENRFEQLKQRTRDKKETVASTHPYGKSGTVVPEIGGTAR